VLGLVRDSGCSAYDCDFIALAIKLNPTLVTMDKKRLKALSERAVALNSG
jgi:predicted nucleic acid-binding protein